MFVCEILEKNNWEHVEFDERKSQSHSFYPF